MSASYLTIDYSTDLPPYQPMTRQDVMTLEVLQAKLHEGFPGFAYIQFELLRLEAADLSAYDTLAITNCMGRIWFDTRVMNKHINEDGSAITLEQKIGVFVHEIGHNIERHEDQSKPYRALGEVRGIPWSEDRANIAMDASINATLREVDGCQLPTPHVYFKGLVTPQHSWVDAYEILFTPPPGGGPAPGDRLLAKGGQGKPGRTPGGFDGHVPAGTPEPGQAPDPGISKQDMDMAVMAAAAHDKQAGRETSSLTLKVGKVHKPRIRWEDLLMQYLLRSSGGDRSDHKRLNRRKVVFDPMVILPARKSMRIGPMLVVQDTSGSMCTPKELSLMIGGCLEVFEQLSPETIHVAEVDTELKRLTKLEMIDELELYKNTGMKGGGGTKFDQFFKLLAAGVTFGQYGQHDAISLDDFEFLLFFTDGVVTLPASPPPGVQVIWLCTTSKTLPWGETIHVDMTDQQ